MAAVPRELAAHFPFRVKTGKAHCEDMFSALPQRADIAHCSRHVCFVPKHKGLNRSRGRSLRHGRASNGWNDESVLPDDDEGPEA